jgi:hypothetical protein|nr:MAG TPA: hypothetical protein [Caudoviricetes sp.]
MLHFNYKFQIGEEEVDLMDPRVTQKITKEMLKLYEKYEDDERIFPKTSTSQEKVTSNQ